MKSSSDITALGNGNGFRHWNYLEAQIQFSPSASESTSIYLDTGCGSTLADEAWIISQIPESEIQHMEIPLRVRGITIRQFIPGQGGLQKGRTFKAHKV